MKEKPKKLDKVSVYGDDEDEKELESILDALSKEFNNHMNGKNKERRE